MLLLRRELKVIYLACTICIFCYLSSQCNAFGRFKI